MRILFDIYHIQYIVICSALYYNLFFIWMINCILEAYGNYLEIEANFGNQLITKMLLVHSNQFRVLIWIFNQIEKSFPFTEIFSFPFIIFNKEKGETCNLFYLIIKLLEFLRGTTITEIAFRRTLFDKGFITWSLLIQSFTEQFVLFTSNIIELSNAYFNCSNV